MFEDLLFDSQPYHKYYLFSTGTTLKGKYYNTRKEAEIAMHSTPLPRYAKPLFTLPMQTPLCQSMPFRYNSVYLISNLRFCFAYHNYIHPCRSLFGNFSPCVSSFP